MTRIFPPFFFYLLFCSLPSIGQMSGELDSMVFSPGWSEEAPDFELSSEEKEKGELFLKDHRVVEYAPHPEAGIAKYYYEHKIVRVNSKEAVDQRNKIYLPVNENSILEQKARVIQPDGSVNVLDTSDIKVAKGEDQQESYRYFALEKVGKGSIVEYYYLYRLSFSYTGMIHTFQSEVPKRNVRFDLYAQAHLRPKLKCFNGLSEPELDTVQGDRVHFLVREDSIAGIEEEPSSAYGAEVKKLAHKLDLTKSGKRLVSYDHFARNIFKRVYSQREESDQEDLIERMQEEGVVDKEADEEKQIRDIEHFLKKNFRIPKGRAPSKIEDILEQETCTELGMLRMFVTALEHYEIEHRLALTSDRFSEPLDPDFSLGSYLQEYLIHFPQHDKFIAPAYPFVRYGLIPRKLAPNKALFIETMELGGEKRGVAKIEEIEALPCRYTQDSLFIKAGFSDETLSELDLKIEKVQTGYYAASSQPYYELLNKDKKEKLAQEMISAIDKDDDAEDVEVENGSAKYLGVKPLVLSGKLTTSEFNIKAADKHLIEVGDLIGEQIELYGDDRERELDVVNRYNHRLYRKIAIEIPEGYEISNPDSVDMEAYFVEESGDTSMAFVSEHYSKGDTLVIEIDEYYKRIHLPVSQFPEYQKVINSAADFNKKKLVLRKEKGKEE